MRLDLTPASHRVLYRASALRLQRGIAAVSHAKLLWSLFEEEECRAAAWLREAGLSKEQFLADFGIQLLASPISAPSFPAGSYGVVAGQYTPPSPPPQGIETAQTSNNPPHLGHPVGTAQEHPQEDEHEKHAESEHHTEPQDSWEPADEPPKYSLYPSRLQVQKQSGQSRLQFYLDDQRVNIGLLTPELEDTLETAALRFVGQDSIRQDRQLPIAMPNGIKPVTFNMPALTLTTELLFLAVLLDNGDVGRWLRENDFDAAELYQRLEKTDRNQEEDGWSQDISLPADERLPDSVPESSLLPSDSLFRLLDASANRCREAMRVLEDYVRFILDDADLTQRFKAFRHELQDILEPFPMQSRLEARNTEQDVGTAISALGEYSRPALVDILSANFSRLQESLRSLEEFSKLFDPQIARQFEQLRYRCYTLQKDTTRTSTQSPVA